MTGLLLLAGGGLAREVLAQERELGRFDDALVLDDDPERWGSVVAGAQVAGGIDRVVEHPERQLLVCCGRGAARAAVVERLHRLGVTRDRFTTSVHPSVSVGHGCRIGPGSILLAGTVLTADVSVAEHVVCMPQVVLTHDDVVEAYATLCAGVTLGGSVTVGRAAYLGMRSSVREGLRIGRGAVVGMGSVLLSDLPDDETWAGVPAQRLHGRATTLAAEVARHEPARSSGPDGLDARTHGQRA